MLEIKFIRQNPEMLQRISDQKGITLSIKELLVWDEKKRLLLKETELLRETRNNLSQQFANSSQHGKPNDLESIKAAAKEVNQQLNEVETALTEAVTQFHTLMILVPNVISPDTPIGRSDEDNVEIKRVGEIPCFDFEPKDHVKLGEIHAIIDIPRGVKVAGKRNYFLKGNGLFLHRAVQQLTLDLLADRGFTALDVPLMVRGAALSNTAFFPLGVDQTFKIAEEDKWLVGTSEVPMVSYYSDEIIDVTEPIKLAAISACFRSEIGAAGKDVHGLYRVHQFAKVEQVILCENDPLVSERILQEITQNAEEIMQLLELPYRIVAVCTGDMSQKTYKQYDIETWMPSRQAYGETHSSSNLHDFQARRSNIRYRTADGTLQYCHTLNNTAVASPRILIPLLENHQEADGSIRIPKALQKYMNGLERITI
ncbi:serine--tRNA ligase [Paenibacillus psychroresistens]|uniref:Serine--tRNA ligase n=1 Tax=Paenibacillus psychroresistens TaxID=1778678 RepID=A0A6B8RPG1_9BACL|nr:serine--tRNA ligase [Paenibacillus psychroresistens]QGQ97266.1 serine--tRNA ligase [Paenibacillus psychroresistens]